MPELTTILSLGLAAAALLCAFLAVWPIVRRRSRRYCPGPRRAWRAMWAPWRWIMAPGCGYDLSGVPAGGALRCSECGAEHATSRALRRSAARVRPFRVAAALLFVAALLPAVVDLRWSKVLRVTPTGPLLMMETYFKPLTPLEVELEVRQRARDGAMNQSQLDRLIELLVRDLRQDAQTNNADRARSMLRSLALQGNTRAYASLYDALSSDDWQQRQIAAYTLQQLPQATPTHELLRVSIEGLRDDDMPHEPVPGSRYGRYTGIENADHCVEYLIVWADRAVPLLEEGMRSDDWQQRLLCAVIAGRAKVKSLMPTAAPILIEHLADNHHRSDAAHATLGLAGFGVDVVPYLEPYVDAADVQQRSRAAQIIERIRQQAREDAARSDE